ncbi:hypothetical protein P9VFCI_161 [Rhizobium phage P9VFCI]|uniref:Uncharacterized protein n=1 Tax=Rhizobium phage P9VFCI TaxID=2763531 RepID=A0A7G7WXP6_9CAUD|nr:hypothetical protein PP937_gp161 [Rhizobium phage P9VFCI]QNH71990.1 hypothetical protein P9VFCI_161 [Rhizobium phage P9VFCI]
MTILAHSLNGLLRLRQLSGTKAVVEIRSHLHPGDWIYCAFRSLDLEEAHRIFHHQCEYHVSKDMYLQPIVQPGV